MLPNWYEATMMLVLMGGAAMVLVGLLCLGFFIWDRIFPYKGKPDPTSWAGPR